MRLLLIERTARVIVDARGIVGAFAEKGKERKVKRFGGRSSALAA
jgi:hypothetical protein